MRADTAMELEIETGLQDAWSDGLINKDTLYSSLPRILEGVDDILFRLSPEQFHQFIWETQNGERGEFCAQRACSCDATGCGRALDELDAMADEAWQRSVDFAGGK